GRGTPSPVPRRRGGGRRYRHRHHRISRRRGTPVSLALARPRRRRCLCARPALMIEAVISDFGGVLTSPLLDSFAAFQNSSGIALEQLGLAMGAILLRDGKHPLFELETGRMTEADF